MDLSLVDQTLHLGGRVVLENVAAEFSLGANPGGDGVFLRYSAAESNSRHEGNLGAIAGLKRFTSCHRFEPFWMEPDAGTLHEEVKRETQWLLAETEAGLLVMIVPLLDSPFRFSVRGTSNGLMLVAESGDATVAGHGGTALFVCTGTDPYAMCREGAVAVRRFLNKGRLRTEKALPEFVDWFGWCTWDAFYREVSAEKVEAGLRSFAAGGVEPRFMILDDGWQSVRRMPTGEDRLTAFAANEKFGGDLAATVRLAKDDFQVRTFLVWHTLLGYWGGTDGGALPGYGVRDVARSFGPDILSYDSRWNEQWWGALVGVVGAEQAATFFADYHRYLRSQGVDGVKVDCQSALEAVAAGQGGRVALTLAYRRALEESAREHFDGCLMNCMANGQESYYLSPDSTLLRTSIDFWPRKPETHGRHLYTNAQVGLWFGEFMHPDWDMFQSAHEWGSFHAAGRVVSGGPVYVSDKPEAHDFDLLRKLVLSDGRVLRAADVGRPTRDCLFADPTRESVLLKVFNRAGDCGLVGLFNARHHANADERDAISGDVKPTDVEGLSGTAFVGFAHRTKRLWRAGRNDGAAISLGEGEWELVTFAPIEHGVASIGLADKLNSAGAVVSKRWSQRNELTIALRDGGEFLAWAEAKPVAVFVDGESCAFWYEEGNGALAATVGGSGPCQVRVVWPSKPDDDSASREA